MLIYTKNFVQKQKIYTNKLPQLKYSQRYASNRNNNDGTKDKEKRPTFTIKKSEGIGYGERDISVLSEYEKTLEHNKAIKYKSKEKTISKSPIHISKLHTIGDIVQRRLLMFWKTPEHLERQRKKNVLYKDNEIIDLPDTPPDDIAKYPKLWPPSSLALGLHLYRRISLQYPEPTYWTITNIKTTNTGRFVFYGIETFRGISRNTVKRIKTYNKNDWYVYPLNIKPSIESWNNIRDKSLRYTLPFTPHAKRLVQQKRQ